MSRTYVDLVGADEIDRFFEESPPGPGQQVTYSVFTNGMQPGSFSGAMYFVAKEDTDVILEPASVSPDPRMVVLGATEVRSVGLQGVNLRGVSIRLVFEGTYTVELEGGLQSRRADITVLFPEGPVAMVRVQQQQQQQQRSTSSGAPSLPVPPPRPSLVSAALPLGLPPTQTFRAMTYESPDTVRVVVEQFLRLPIDRQQNAVTFLPTRGDARTLLNPNGYEFAVSLNSSIPPNVARERIVRRGQDGAVVVSQGSPPLSITTNQYAALVDNFWAALNGYAATQGIDSDLRQQFETVAGQLQEYDDRGTLLPPMATNRRSSSLADVQIGNVPLSVLWRPQAAIESPVRPVYFKVESSDSEGEAQAEDTTLASLEIDTEVDTEVDTDIDTDVDRRIDERGYMTPGQLSSMQRGEQVPRTALEDEGYSSTEIFDGNEAFVAPGRQLQTFDLLDTESESESSVSSSSSSVSSSSSSTSRSEGLRGELSGEETERDEDILQRQRLTVIRPPGIRGIVPLIPIEPAVNPLGSASRQRRRLVKRPSTSPLASPLPQQPSPPAQQPSPSPPARPTRRKAPSLTPSPPAPAVLPLTPARSSDSNLAAATTTTTTTTTTRTTRRRTVAPAKRPRTRQAPTATRSIFEPIAIFTGDADRSFSFPTISAAPPAPPAPGHVPAPIVASSTRRNRSGTAPPTSSTSQPTTTTTTQTTTTVRRTRAPAGKKAATAAPATPNTRRRSSGGVGLTGVPRTRLERQALANVRLREASSAAEFNANLSSTRRSQAFANTMLMLQPGQPTLVSRDNAPAVPLTAYDPAVVNARRAEADAQRVLLGLEPNARLPPRVTASQPFQNLGPVPPTPVTVAPFGQAFTAPFQPQPVPRATTASTAATTRDIIARRSALLAGNEPIVYAPPSVAPVDLADVLLPPEFLTGLGPLSSGQQPTAVSFTRSPLPPLPDPFA